MAWLALEVALADLRQRIASAQPARLEEELAGLDAKIERALDLAIELGDLGAAKEKLRGLRTERDQVASELARTRVRVPSAEELMPRLREMLRSIEATIRSDVALGRLAIAGLLGESRVRVHADGRIEGLATLSPEMKLAAPQVSPGAARSCGSGGPLHACCVDLPVRIAA